MIVVLLNTYLVILFLLVHFGVVRFNLFWKVSPFIVLVVLLVGLFIPMNWGAPSGPVLVVRPSIAIVPDVSGEVIEVPVEANRPLKAGEVLFRIDPLPFQSQVDALEAQLTFARLRQEQMSALQRSDAGRAFDVQQRESEVQQLEAQLDGAKWNLEKTVVRAPADGFVTNLALRKGARVSNLSLSPAMAFIESSAPIVGAEIAQIDARYLKAGQEVEMTFKFFPGRIVTGKVETVIQAVASGQTQVSGAAVSPEAIKAAPFVVRVALDDKDLERSLPAGSTGTAAIFTDRVGAAHVIRKVLLRQQAIMNYVLPF